MSNIIASTTYRVILGLGATGLSVARFLFARGDAFVVLDTRDNPPGLSALYELDSEIGVFCGEFTDDTVELCLNATEIVISPGIDRRSAPVQKALDAGVGVVGDVELFLREVSVPVIGITGSNGKTTVTTLVKEVALNAGINVCAAGNIGLPALDALAMGASLYVLELSSFQLESVTRAGLTVACILNVSEDHLDRYDGFADYCMAKHRIYFGARSVVYNLQDKLTHPPLVDDVARRGFGLLPCLEKHEEQYVLSACGTQLLKGDELLINVNDLKLFGSHNIANVLAVFAICDALNIPIENVRDTVSNFRGIAHRCEWVQDIAGTTYINDSKATNVGAAIAAITGLKDAFKNIVLIAGGEGKGADFSSLGDCINQYVQVVVLIGRDASEIKTTLSEKVIVLQASSIKHAVSLASERTSQDGLVLLSPACASFDMFSGYEDRGNQFKSCVQELAA